MASDIITDVVKVTEDVVELVRDLDRPNVIRTVLDELQRPQADEK